ncbi:MAG: class I SAM-dependent methyltransferase [Magnetococcales bacterium]|nr:class I SAM-dependent methyltransferase [Magnetococcales bacterium]
MHDPLIQALIDIHRELPRKGPGDDDLSRQLMAYVRPLLPAPPRMVDMGCGNGHSAFLLIKELRGHVTAVDFAEPFINELKRRLVNEPITPVLGDMLKLGLEPKSVDLIWSEGAAFAVGIDNALKTWSSLLKPQGVLVYSDAVWFTPEPSAEVSAFWQTTDPNIRSVGENINRAERLGYRFLAAHSMTQTVWWASYYDPMKKRLDQLEPTVSSGTLMADVIASARREAELFKRYGHEYGYAFFVLQKR